MHVILVSADKEALHDLLKIVLILVFDAVLNEILVRLGYVEIVARDSLFDLVVMHQDRQPIVLFVHVNLDK